MGDAGLLDPHQPQLHALLRGQVVVRSLAGDQVAVTAQQLEQPVLSDIPPVLLEDFGELTNKDVVLGALHRSGEEHLRRVRRGLGLERMHRSAQLADLLVGQAKRTGHHLLGRVPCVLHLDQVAADLPANVVALDPSIPNFFK